jgi:ribosomal protein S27AE
MPPQVVVELDEPWSGETLLTVRLQNIKLIAKGAVFRKPLFDLWPDQVPDKPASTLRPTTEPIVKISKLLKISQAALKAQNTLDETSVRRNVSACPHCGCSLAAKEKWVCNTCKDEIKGFMGEDFVDPNGPQWYATVMRRMPLVRLFPYR